MATDTTDTSGSIYDIGYRGHDGPRMGRAYRVRTLLLHTFRSAFGLGRTGRAKIAPFLLLTMLCMPAIVMIGVTSMFDLAALPVDYSFFVVDVQVLHTIWLAVLAPFAVSRDLRFRVTTLYFSRPLARFDYLVAKVVATIAALLVMLIIPSLILFLGAVLAKLDLSDELSDLTPALVMGFLLAILLAAIGLLISSLAPRRGMGIAAIVTVLLVLGGVQIVVDEIGQENASFDTALYSGVIAPYSLVERLVAGIFDRPFADNAIVPEGFGQTSVFAIAYLAIVVGCFGLLALRYRKVSVL